VGWIELDKPKQPSLKFAPIYVGSDLKKYLWDKRTAILTSATIPSNLEQRLGLLETNPRKEDLESPFDYKNHTLLYCARHLSDPSLDYEEWRAGVLEELTALIGSAKGRTLALFTSLKALEAARDHLRVSLELPILCQGDLPEKRLLAEFSSKNEASLLATRRFWQGIDVPGPTLSLVTIDRLPFPSPNEHLIKARSAAANPNGWWKIELPICATRLAQGAGRLIRQESDQGVVAILDCRLASRAYKSQLLQELPAMRRTTDRQEVQSFLRDLRGR
jgi:ATP-dependent DNA helicase DinG